MKKKTRKTWHAPRMYRPRGAIVTLAAASAALCIAAPHASAADDAAYPAFKLRGFGTLGAARADVDNADFVSGFFAPNGAGFTRRWSGAVDSKIGVQADAQISDKLSAVVQLVSRQHYDNGFAPKVEWANAKYQFTPDFDVRLGRTVAMPFMVSDSRLVGFGNIWVRPPQEVYGLIPITNKDGIDGSYRIHSGDMTHTLHASYGQTKLSLPASGSVKAKRYFDVSDSVEYGPLTFRVSYSSGRVDLHTTGFDALVDGYAQFGNALAPFPPFAAASRQALDLSAKYRFENAPISSYSVGASYDRDRWLFMAEWAKFNGYSLLADSTAAYATAAYRMGPFTPYLSVAKLTADNRSESGVSTVGLPPAAATTANALNGGLNTALIAAAFAQKSFSAGLRWDVMKSAALKAQYDHLVLAAGSSGRLGNVQPGFQPGGRVNVLSVVLDFTF